MRYCFFIFIFFFQIYAQSQQISAWHKKSDWDKITPYQSKIDSLKAEEALLVADALFRRRNIEGAKKVLLRIQNKKNYKTHQLYWQLSQVNMVENEWELALEHIELALKTQPANRVYKDTRAGVLFQLKKYDLAQIEYMQLFKSKNSDFKSFMMTYQCMAAQENYRESYLFLRKNKNYFTSKKQRTSIYEELIKNQLYHYKNLDSAFFYLNQAENFGYYNENILIYGMTILNQKKEFKRSESYFFNYKQKWIQQELSASAQKKNTVLFDEFRNSGIGFQVFKNLNDPQKFTVFLQDIKGMYIVGKIEVLTHNNRLKLNGKSNFEALEKSYDLGNNYGDIRNNIIKTAKELLKTDLE